MQENNKYYTPSIEEFHVGFEYEVKNMDGVWEKFTMKPPDTIPNLDADHYRFIKDLYRVKHLDQQDIESLEWKDISSIIHRPNLMKFEIILEEDYYFLVFAKNGNIQIFTVDDCCVFDGKLKNKSELKKLMQQLGIIKINHSIIIRSQHRNTDKKDI